MSISCVLLKIPRQYSLLSESPILPFEPPRLDGIQFCILEHDKWVGVEDYIKNLGTTTLAVSSTKWKLNDDDTHGEVNIYTRRRT
jgi:hypothetical protein